MTTSDYRYLPRLVGNILRSPDCLGGNQLAEDPNTSWRHDSKDSQLEIGAWASWWNGLTDGCTMSAEFG
jgi:hypothetical protein